MRRYTILATALWAAGFLLAGNCQAQNEAPLLITAGATSAFNSFALAARISNPGGLSGVCGDHNWTFKSGGSGVDGRSASIAAVSGNIWIVWNDTAEPNRTVCAYVSVDSATANRLYFAVPRGTLSIPSSEIGAAGNNLVPLLPPDEALPSNIYADLNGLPFNAAPTEVRPEDALFATTRALAPLNMVNYTGLGYGPSPIGTSILSSFSTKSAPVVAFAISGNDPITGMAVPKSTTLDVGASPFIVFVNSTDTAVGGLGNAEFNNVDRFVLSLVFNGTLTRTRDLIPSTGLPIVPLTVLTREPTAGAYNIFEFCVPRSVEVNSTQELNVNPASSDGNPLNITAADGAKRQRAIGTSEIVSEVGLLQNSIGYAAWSFSNFAPVVTTAKYLTVDGVDPIQASYTGGTLPQCTAPCTGELTFPNVANGSYPIWNVLRIVTASPAPAGISALVTAAESEVINIPDFIAFNELQVFRSHYKQSGVQPKNGHLPRSVEAGGDMGGAVLTVQADLDNITDTGKELVNLKQ